MQVISLKMHQILWLLDITAVWYNSKLCFDPRILCKDSEWFNALQLVPPTPEVLEEIKTTMFCIAFCPLNYRLELSHNAI